jgi:hypothetical protein
MKPDGEIDLGERRDPSSFGDIGLIEGLDADLVHGLMFRATRHM